MGRSVLLFLLIGLAIGLWLGFNPTTHRQLVEFWNRASIQAPTDTAQPAGHADQWSLQFNRWLRSTTRPHAEAPAQPEPVPTGPQISAELRTFWSALERIWLNFIERLHKATI